MSTNIQITGRCLQCAEQIIARTGPNKPADAALRDYFKTKGEAHRDFSASISKAVFDYYRWLGFIDRSKKLSLQLQEAADISEDFSLSPDTFRDSDLLAKAIPSWVMDCMDVSPVWVRRLQLDPLLWLRTKSNAHEKVMHELGDCQVSSVPLAPAALRYSGPLDLFKTQTYREGMFEIQDIASQIVAHVCRPLPGETWWDTCAGEGGKTLHLSDLMENRGVIWASDRSAARLKKLKQRAARAGCFNYQIVSWDGSSQLPFRTKFDGILVDAPCSGIGTWQRNPHARWTTHLEDVQELAALQLSLLQNASKALKPGGRLIYSVCTLSRQETWELARSFETQLAGLDPWPVPPSEQHKPGTPPHQLILWPQEIQGNGMFISSWQKIKT